MSNEPYYLAYESRYKKVYEAGVERWGHAPTDETLVSTLTAWVTDNKLQSKRIIEFACGEGACREILSELGCIYHGVDIAPSAIEKSRKALERYPAATVSLLDMVNEQIAGRYDAAIDIMGFHMLVTDTDRNKYLQNAYNCLAPGAPMLFFRETYRKDAPASNEKIESIEQWIAITGDDYHTPQIRTASQNGIKVEVNIPLVPARAKNKEGYIKELSHIGFMVDDFIEMDVNYQCPYSASIFVHKPIAP
jgi:SAM-dependent methyltransferase